VLDADAHQVRVANRSNVHAAIQHVLGIGPYRRGEQCGRAGANRIAADQFGQRGDIRRLSRRLVGEDAELTGAVQQHHRRHFVGGDGGRGLIHRRHP